MDSLSGELMTMEIGEVLSLIGGKRLTGLLSFENAAVTETFFIQEGNVIFCSSNQRQHSFGQMLRQFDHISEADLNAAWAAKERENTLLGVQLVRMGFMTQEQVVQSLVAKARELLLDIVQWQSGTFRFLRNALPSNLPAIDISVDLNSLLNEVEFRKTVWESMRQVFLSDRVTFILHEDRLVRSPAPGSLDEKLFEMVRNGSCISEIGEALFRSAFFLYQKLYALYRQGALEIGPERPEDVPMFVGESLNDVNQLMAMAQEFLINGNYGQADLIVSQMMEMASDDSDVQLFKERLDSAHLRDLRRRFVEPNLCPRLIRAIGPQDGITLTPQEKYLLSRIDGTKPVRVLLRVVPMREFDALKCLEHFIDAGIAEISRDNMPVAIP